MMTRRETAICLCLSLAIAAGWGSGTAAAQETHPTVASASDKAAGAPSMDRSSEKADMIVTPEYIIGPEDVLEIIVWRNADLSKVVTVRPDGRISLPLIGDVEATGLTPSKLTQKIVERLKQYKETPTVSVILTAVNSYGVFVLGEVTKPGRYSLKSKTTLLQAITNAGGFTPLAARNKIVVFRLADGQTAPNGHTGEIKLKASYDDIVLRDNSTGNVMLRPGDTIVIPSETMVLTQ